LDALETLVIRAQTNDLDAYSALVRRFQDMAVGYAYSILGDFHLAEDAAQEAFVRAYLDLGKLREPLAFAGWFKHIVFVRCNRITRRKQIPTVQLETELVSDQPLPDELFEQQETKTQVLDAVQSLPESEREVTTLYYLGGYAQKEIGEFLEISAQTVKSRLHTARRHLRERMMNMVEENLQNERPSKDPAFEIKVIQELEEITQLSDKEIQMMLREVDTKDLALALINASDALKERIFANMSARVRTLIQEYIESIEPIEEDRLAKGKALVVKLVQDLIEKGTISWPPLEEEKPVKKLSDEYLKMKEDLLAQFQNIPLSNLDLDGLTETIVNMANIARFEGILELQKIDSEAQNQKGSQNEFFNLGLRLIIDGVAPQLVEELMEGKKKALLHQFETQLDMIMTGIQSTQFGNNPRIIEQKLKVMY